VQIRAEAYFLEAPGAPLARRELVLPQPRRHQAIVQVLACGLCPTDRGLWSGATPARHPLPLVLGHQVIGKVVLAWERFGHLVGRLAMVPAIVPCGDCEACQSGRDEDCEELRLLGCDLHGGFATHLLVPSVALLRLDGAPSWIDVRELAPLVDAAAAASAVQRGATEWRASADRLGKPEQLAAELMSVLSAPAAACQVDSSAAASGRCPRELYQKTLQLAFDGQLALNKLVTIAPLSNLGQLLENETLLRSCGRLVLDPSE
jgi:NADPH:quinone reductase-like Zn-dependent oxidoreductase